MKHVPIAAFKDRLSEYVDAVEAGEEVIITRHGKPTAKLVSINDDTDRRIRARRAVDQLMAHRQKMLDAGSTATVDEWIAWKNEGRP